MIKKTLNLKDVKALNKTEQKEIIGGHWGSGGFGCNQAQLVECESDFDCPCDRRCGLTTNGFNFPNICEIL